MGSEGSGPTPTTGNHGITRANRLEANAVQLVTSSCPVAGQLQLRPARPEALATIPEEASNSDGPGTSTGAGKEDLHGHPPTSTEASSEDAAKVSKPKQVETSAQLVMYGSALSVSWSAAGSATWQGCYAQAEAPGRQRAKACKQETAAAG